MIDDTRPTDNTVGFLLLPIPKIIWHELTSRVRPSRQNEPLEVMDDLDQVKSYVEAYAWGGPTSALQLHHLRELSRLIRPGDLVLDLACGPGPLLLELAAIYPDCRFFGADLSATMLQYLEQEAALRGLENILVLQEDVRTLPTFENKKVDLVISTSALHHLPDEGSVRQVFRRIESLLNAEGGFYMFDFGLLNSPRSRELCVAEVAKLAPPLTARDYDLSLQAAFPIDRVFAMARDDLPTPFSASSSALMNFFFFLQTPPRATAPVEVQGRLAEIWKSLSFEMRMEHLFLRWFRREAKQK